MGIAVDLYRYARPRTVIQLPRPVVCAIQYLEIVRLTPINELGINSVSVPLEEESRLRPNVKI